MKPITRAIALLTFAAIALLTLPGCIVVASGESTVTFHTDISPLSNIQAATTRSQNGEEGNKEGTASGGGTTDLQTDVSVVP
ncbi:MAG: hypothetical protein ABQ298_03775 [Puniceicoccaceae bacterium]